MDRSPGFRQTTVAVVGVGALASLPEHCHRLGMGRPGVLIDGALAEGSVGEAVRELVPSAPFVVADLGEPTFQSVRTAADGVRSAGIDGLVAVGGGSTIDTGKILRGLLASDTDDPTLVPDDEALNVLPYVAVPTTAGTGAEMGPSAVVIDPRVNEKVLIRVRALAADVAIADGRLTLGLPSNLTAFTGCDALAQALMAYVSAGDDAVSGQLALRAVNLIFNWLPRAVEDGGDIEARDGMMIGSVTSAIAMFNSPIMYACEHAFAEPLASILRIPHGHLVAAFLPGVAECNAEPLQVQYANVARMMHFVEQASDDLTAARALVDRLRALVKELGIPGLSVVSEPQPLELLVDWCMRSETYDLNPVRFPLETAHSIVSGAWEGTFRAKT